jgi:hypothetical protein
MFVALMILSKDMFGRIENTQSGSWTVTFTSHNCGRILKDFLTFAMTTVYNLWSHYARNKIIKLIPIILVPNLATSKADGRIFSQARQFQ